MSHTRADTDSDGQDAETVTAGFLRNVRDAKRRLRKRFIPSPDVDQD